MAAGVALASVAGCAMPERDEDPPTETALVLFPLNVVPDVVVDTVGMAIGPFWVLFGGRLATWPQHDMSLTFGSPVFGPATGIQDAAYGRPFWDATIFHELCARPERPAKTTESPPPADRQGDVR